MRKRDFRSPPPARPVSPAYPTLERFDQGRRAALLRLGALGAAVLGAGSLLAGCGERSVATPQDGGGPDSLRLAGTQPAFDARVDERRQLPDQRRPQPDQRRPDQRLPDQRLPDQRLPDANILQGEMIGPDARIEEPDSGTMAGGAPMPPAVLDGGR